MGQVLHGSARTAEAVRRAVLLKFRDDFDCPLQLRILPFTG
jgi:hypothetical protein